MLHAYVCTYVKHNIYICTCFSFGINCLHPSTPSFLSAIYKITCTYNCLYPSTLSPIYMYIISPLAHSSVLPEPLGLPPTSKFSFSSSSRVLSLARRPSKPRPLSSRPHPFTSPRPRCTASLQQEGQRYKGMNRRIHVHVQGCTEHIIIYMYLYNYNLHACIYMYMYDCTEYMHL